MKIKCCWCGNEKARLTSSKPPKVYCLKCGKIYHER